MGQNTLSPVPRACNPSPLTSAYHAIILCCCSQCTCRALVLPPPQACKLPCDAKNKAKIVEKETKVDIGKILGQHEDLQSRLLPEKEKASKGRAGKSARQQQGVGRQLCEGAFKETEQHKQMSKHEVKLRKYFEGCGVMELPQVRGVHLHM